MLNITILEIKRVKYYLISVDSTPDSTNIGQLTFVFRYALSDGTMEQFRKFIPICGHTGHQLIDILLEFIEDKGIILIDLREQSYNNASFMSGIYKSMQAIMKERNH